MIQIKCLCSDNSVLEGLSPDLVSFEGKGSGETPRNDRAHGHGCHLDSYIPLCLTREHLLVGQNAWRAEHTVAAYLDRTEGATRRHAGWWLWWGGSHSGGIWANEEGWVQKLIPLPLVNGDTGKIGAEGPLLDTSIWHWWHLWEISEAKNGQECATYDHLQMWLEGASGHNWRSSNAPDLLIPLFAGFSICGIFKRGSLVDVEGKPACHYISAPLI